MVWFSIWGLGARLRNPTVLVWFSIWGSEAGGSLRDRSRLLLLNWVLFVGVNAAFMEKLMARGRTGVDAAVADVANPNSNSHDHGRLHVFMYPDHLVVCKMPEEHSATHGIIWISPLLVLVGFGSARSIV